MNRRRILLALGFLVQIGSAQAAGPSGLGFDPAKFGVPIYPNAKLIPGTPASIPSGYGRVRRLAVLKTADPEDRVAAWYTAHWKAAQHRAFPHMHMDQFATGSGATNVTVSITNPAGDTEIHVMVPGS